MTKLTEHFVSRDVKKCNTEHRVFVIFTPIDDNLPVVNAFTEPDISNDNSVVVTCRCHRVVVVAEQNVSTTVTAVETEPSNYNKY